MEAVSHIAGRRAVTKIEPARVAALLNHELVPALPHRVLALARYEKARAPDNSLSAIAWFVTGDPFAPSGIMGLEPRYDAAYGRWALEMHELRGKTIWEIRALCFHARDLARENKWLLTGEIDAENAHMRDLAAIIFSEPENRQRKRPDRVRYSWEF